ncbi:hypothetical protein AN958_04287 [Leucoagaricus sp. SymC.cos]|nr:hypothetical protein AN958_04287 [Leucoagaricus sp. SymC.cos]
MTSPDSTPSAASSDQGSSVTCPLDAPEPVFPLEIWTIVEGYLPWKIRLILGATCKTLRNLLPPRFECVTLTLADCSVSTAEFTNQLLLRKIDFFASPEVALSVKICRLNFHTKRVPSLPPTPDVCTPLFSVVAKFKNLTDLDCFRILFDECHVNVINSLPNLIRAEFTECQWMHRQPVPFEDRMQLRHLLVDHGPNRQRYNWLFNTHPDHLVSLVLTSGMPAALISGFLPPLPNLESLEINGIAMLHPEIPSFFTLCPALIELRVTTDSLWPSYARAADAVVNVISAGCIPDLRMYEGPVNFLPAFTRGRLVTHVGVYACPLLMQNFTIKVGSAFKKQQIRSLKIRVPIITDQIIALLCYFKAILAVEIVVTNEGQPPESKQTYLDVLAALDTSTFHPPRNLEYLSIAEEATAWGTPKESPWYQYQRESQQRVLSQSPTQSLLPPSLSEARSFHTTTPGSSFIQKCHNLQYVMLSDGPGVIAAWNPRTSFSSEIKTIRQWQRQRLGLFEPVVYNSL